MMVGGFAPHLFCYYIVYTRWSVTMFLIKKRIKMNKNALTLCIAITRKMMPVVLQMLRDVEAARDEKSDGGRRLTKKEKWIIAEEACFSILPSLIDVITDSLD